MHIFIWDAYERFHNFLVMLIVMSTYDLEEVTKLVHWIYIDYFITALLLVYWLHFQIDYGTHAILHAMQ